MRKWGILSIFITVLCIWLIPSTWLQARYFLGAFGIGLGVVLLIVGKLPWMDEDSNS